MPRQRPHRLNRPVAGRLDKSLPAALTAGANGQIRTGSDLLAIAQGRNAVTGGLVDPLPRDPGNAANFGPGMPLIPAALDPVRRDTGRPEPRISEYPQSWNLPGTRGSHVPWRILRDAAELPIISDCIRIRKEEVATEAWEIAISPRAVAQAHRDAPGSSRRSVESDMRKRLLPEIDRLRAFWEEPDPTNGLHFPAWITQLLDEQMVLDALAIWPRKTIGGDVIGLTVLDGSTIKPLLNEYGGRPQPPFPSYQQILYGFPRGEFTADAIDTDGGVVIPGAFGADQLVYEVRDRRTWTPYGRSAVEVALLDIDTWMKRVSWLRAEYTDGTVPAGWLMNTGPNPGTWTPQQLFEYETALNDTYSGDIYGRRRIRMLPPGWEPQTQAEIGEKFKADYDLHLLKLLVAHFDSSIFELGFTEGSGLNGGAQHAQGQENLNDRKGSEPTLRRVQSILTRLQRRHLDAPPELEFRWERLATDDGGADTAAIELFAAAGMTLNELRDETGRPRYAFPEADMAAIVSARTGAITFLEGSSQPAEPMPPQPQSGTLDNQPGTPGEQTDPDTGDSARRPGKPAPAAPVTPPDPAKAAEAAAYKRWAGKSRSGRRFTLEHLRSPQDLDTYGIDPSRVTFLAKAANDHPKAGDPAVWPGWAVDQATAQHWADSLRTALTAALPVGKVAAEWLDSQKANPQRGQHRGQRQGDEPDAGILAIVGAATAYLGASTAALTSAVAGVLADASADGWWIGQASAAAVLDGRDVDWQGWTPGRPDTARSLIEDPDGLKAFIDALDVDDIARTRLERLAQVMAQAVAEDWSRTRLADAMRDVLDDPAAADSVAITTVIQASSRAALATCRAAGVEHLRWSTEEDDRVCPICDGNEAVGLIPIGTAFPSGDLTPPAHPRCRCALTI